MKNPASGRILTVAVDHAPSYGVLAGLENIQDVVDRVASAGPDALLLMKGTAAALLPALRRAGRPDPEILHAVALPSPARCVGQLGGGRRPPGRRCHRHGPDRRQPAAGRSSLSNLGALVREAEQAGMPVIVHAYPNGELVPPDEVFTAERVGYASRLAMELGVDIVKTFYTGSAESFAQVVEMASPALVVAAGGPRLETDADVLRMAHDVVQAGAAGLTFGRNIWQSANPAALIQALKHVLHHDAVGGGGVGECSAGCRPRLGVRP